MAQKDPAQRASYQSAWYASNREHARAAQKAWRSSEGGARHKFNRTLRKHGLTALDWNNFWRDQDGKCAGCVCPLLLGNQTHIDHCHATGLVRGLLCSECNLALGKVKDSAETLKRLAAYLECVSEKQTKETTWQE